MRVNSSVFWLLLNEWNHVREKGRKEKVRSKKLGVRDKKGEYPDSVLPSLYFTPYFSLFAEGERYES